MARFGSQNNPAFCNGSVPVRKYVIFMCAYSCVCSTYVYLGAMETLPLRCGFTMFRYKSFNIPLTPACWLCMYVYIYTHMPKSKTKTYDVEIFVPVKVLIRFWCSWSENIDTSVLALCVCAYTYTNSLCRNICSCEGIHTLLLCLE